MRAGVAYLAFVVLAGCVDRPAQEQDALVGSTPLDHAFVQYAEDGRPDNWITMSLSPANVWTPRLEHVPGIVARLGQSPGSTNLIEGNLEGVTGNDPPIVQAIGSDACGAPVWEWITSEGSPGRPLFYSEPLVGLRPEWFGTVLSLQRPQLPPLGDEAAKQVGTVAPTQDDQRAFLHGALVLHVAASGGTWLAKWTEADEPGPLLDAAQWTDAARLHWAPDAPFPERVVQGSTTWQRVMQVNEGSPFPACQPTPLVTTYGWGPWGPEQELPLPVSLKDVMDIATVHPDVVDLRLRHPDAYFAELIIYPPVQTDTEATGHWQLHFGYPGGSSGPVIACKVRDGGQEGIDAIVCPFSGQWAWNDGSRRPAVDWASMRASDFWAPFAFMQAYDPGEADRFISFSFHESPIGDQAPWIPMSIVHRLHADDALDLSFEPKDPAAIGVIGLDLEAFISSPGPMAT